MFTIVSFDIGGTLIDYSYFEHVWEYVIPQLYSEKMSLPFNIAKKYVLKEYDLLGNTDIRWYLPEYWFQHFNLNTDAVEVFRSQTDKLRFYPEVPAVLEKLNHKYFLITASGIPTNVQEIILENYKPLFRKLFSSITNLQIIKKNTKFYQLICNVLQVHPATILHVGDDWYSDYLVPQKMGIASLLLNRKSEKNGTNMITNLEGLYDHL